MKAARRMYSGGSDTVDTFRICFPVVLLVSQMIERLFFLNYLSFRVSQKVIPPNLRDTVLAQKQTSRFAQIIKISMEKGPRTSPCAKFKIPCMQKTCRCAYPL
jgi:hypothetical protein